MSLFGMTVGGGGASTGGRAPYSSDEEVGSPHPPMPDGAQMYVAQAPANEVPPGQATFGPTPNATQLLNMNVLGIHNQYKSLMSAKTTQTYRTAINYWNKFIEKFYKSDFERAEQGLSANNGRATRNPDVIDKIATLYSVTQDKHVNFLSSMLGVDTSPIPQMYQQNKMEELLIGMHFIF